MSKKTKRKPRKLVDGKLTFGEKRAARRLGVSYMTLFRRRKKGLIRFYKVGNRLLYDDECLTEFLEKRCQLPPCSLLRSRRLHNRKSKRNAQRMPGRNDTLFSVFMNILGSLLFQFLLHFPYNDPHVRQSLRSKRSISCSR